MATAAAPRDGTPTADPNDEAWYRQPAAAAFFTALPKIELHAHLSGSISRQCLHEIWKAKTAKGEALHLQDPLIAMDPATVTIDIETFFPLFSSYIYELINDAAAVVASTTAVLHAFLADGVRYLELRTTPRALPAAGLSAADYVALVLRTLAAFHDDHPALTTNLILSIDRHRHDPAAAADIVALAQQRHAAPDAHGPRVVGVDLCGNPLKGDVGVFADAFAAARAAGLRTTVHFAETPQSGAARELQTLLAFAPDRLGHVIYVDAAARAEIARRRLGLELCLSCNVRLRMMPGGVADHHFGYWRDTPCPIVLCTDDVGVVGSPLSREYRLVAEHFRLSRREVCELVRRGVECIFGTEEQKAALREQLW